jgi:hypothetical protein
METNVTFHNFGLDPLWNIDKFSASLTARLFTSGVCTYASISNEIHLIYPMRSSQIICNVCDAIDLLSHPINTCFFFQSSLTLILKSV